MSQLILYKIDLSPPACAVRMLGDILGIEFDLKDVNFGNLEHKSPEYLKLNPLGTIPVLQDGDFTLVDSHAIMKYLLEQYGGAQRDALYPRDVRTRALVDQCLFFDTGVYFIKVKIIALPTLFEGMTGPTEKHLEEIEACYGVVEAYLGNKKFIATDYLTIADLSVGATTAALQAIHKLDAKKFPRTVEWLSRLLELPYFKKYIVPASESLTTVLQSCWEKNKQSKQLIK